MEKLPENVVDKALVALAAPQIALAKFFGVINWTEVTMQLTALLLALRVVDWGVRRVKFGWRKEENTALFEKDEK